MQMRTRKGIRGTAKMMINKNETKEQEQAPEQDFKHTQHQHHRRCKHCEANEKLALELTDTTKRVQAEFENYQKRSAKEQEDFRKYAVERFLTKMLPVLDSFDQALKHANGDDSKDQGLRLVHQQLITLLKEEGLMKIETVGKRYDPHNAEVMLTANQEPSNIVLEEFQAGYSFLGRVLRHAKVKISIPQEDAAHNEANNATK